MFMSVHVSVYGWRAERGIAFRSFSRGCGRYEQLCVCVCMPPSFCSCPNVRDTSQLSPASPSSSFNHSPSLTVTPYYDENRSGGSSWCAGSWRRSGASRSFTRIARRVLSVICLHLYGCLCAVRRARQVSHMHTSMYGHTCVCT